MLEFKSLEQSIKHIFESGANEIRIMEMCLNLFKTGVVDVSGRNIILGDIVTYDYEEKESSFEIVFEDGAFRKKYNKWPKNLPRPLLYDSVTMRLKVIESKFFI